MTQKSASCNFPTPKCRAEHGELDFLGPYVSYLLNPSTGAKQLEAQTINKPIFCRLFSASYFSDLWDLGVLVVGMVVSPWIFVQAPKTCVPAGIPHFPYRPSKVSEIIKMWDSSRHIKKMRGRRPPLHNICPCWNFSFWKLSNTFNGL